MKSDDWMLFQKEDEKKYGPITSSAKKLYLTSDSSESFLENAARQVSEIADISIEVPRRVFHSFEGLEHRLEKFGESRGVSFVNDSKSTTPASLIWALSRYADHSVVLIAGGRVKTPSFVECLPLLRQKAKKIIVIGDARDLMLKEWSALQPTAAATLEEACSLAKKSAEKGDTILFSPACSSFDMFKNYVDRGNQFKFLINQFIAKN